MKREKFLKRAMGFLYIHTSYQGPLYICSSRLQHWEKNIGWRYLRIGCWGISLVRLAR